jgi:hypothetical protein
MSITQKEDRIKELLLLDKIPLIRILQKYRVLYGLNESKESFIKRIIDYEFKD